MTDHEEPAGGDRDRPEPDPSEVEWPDPATPVAHRHCADPLLGHQA